MKSRQNITDAGRRRLQIEFESFGFRIWLWERLLRGHAEFGWGERVRDGSGHDG